jgi:hypothetical protein
VGLAASCLLAWHHDVRLDSQFAYVAAATQGLLYVKVQPSAILHSKLASRDQPTRSPVLYASRAVASRLWLRAGAHLIPSSFIWQVLAYLKVLNQPFATYVLCLFQIVRDIRSFLVILLLVMLAFANMFYLVSYRARLLGSVSDDGGLPGRQLKGTGAAQEPVLLGGYGSGAGVDDDGEDDAAGAAFGSAKEALVSVRRVRLDRTHRFRSMIRGHHSTAMVRATCACARGQVYRMMIGDFEREWFPTPFTLGLFLAYMFVVMILMLNVLIAVVSDSYDFAVIRSQVLFRRACVPGDRTRALGVNGHRTRHCAASASHLCARCRSSRCRRLELAAELEALKGSLPAVRSLSRGQSFRQMPTYLVLTEGDGEGEGAEGRPQAASGPSWWDSFTNLLRIRDGGADAALADAPDEDWLGRALDTERRVKRLLEQSEARMAAHMDKVEAKLLAANESRGRSLFF